MHTSHYLSLMFLASRCYSASLEQSYCVQYPSLFSSLQCPLDLDHNRIPQKTGWVGPYGCLDGYCLYSNRDFANSRGIVVVTTEQGLVLVKNISPVNGKSDLKGGYHVDKITDKGLGLVADEIFHRGDGVMSQSPVFLAHKNFMENPSHRQRQQNLLDQAVDLLPSRTRRLFLNQMGHSGGHIVSDILFTNTFQIKLASSESHHYGNYPEISRFNHDCRPNVAFYIDANLSHHTTVVSDVVPGEELSITYLDPFESWPRRQQRALSSWGFGCTCKQCSLNGGESDGRLDRIRELEGQLEDPTTSISMDTVYQWMDLHVKERLDVKLAGALTLAALNANLLGKADETERYALQAVEAGLIEGGESRDVMDMRELGMNPRGHFTWRMRLT